MAAARPIYSEDELAATANRIWASMDEVDWLEAFACHPRIGARKAEPDQSASARWSQQEQASTACAEIAVLDRLADGNRRYEERNGFTYIVCATGKSAEEMLEILTRRLASDHAEELQEAAEQQRQILHIRLRKWLNG
jgi:OHCU decarboxylase